MANPEQFRQFLAILVNMFDAHTAALFLRANESENHRLVAHFSLSGDVNPEAEAAPGVGLVGWVARSGQPLNVASLDRTRGHTGYYLHDVDIKAFMAIPLDDGILCLDTMGANGFSPKEQKIFQQCSQFLGKLIETGGRLSGDEAQATYYRALGAMTALREKFSRWPAFLEHFLALLTLTSGMDGAFLAVRDPRGDSYGVDGTSPKGLLRGDELGPFPMGSGLVGWVFNNNSVVVTGEDGQGSSPLLGAEKGQSFGRAICLPLAFQRKVRGVLVLGSKAPGPMSQDLKDFLKLSAANLSLFLENLYLRSRQSAV